MSALKSFDAGPKGIGPTIKATPSPFGAIWNTVWTITPASSVPFKRTDAPLTSMGAL
jgi:hypothetical protein